jgi:RND family efflux transporter MFP subunit
MNSPFYPPSFSKDYADRFLALLLLMLTISASSTPLHAEEMKPKSVGVAAANKLYIFPIFDAPARVVSLNDTKVSAQTAGVIKQISVRVGDKVQKGELTALLDCADYEAVQQGEKAELTAARARFDFAVSRLKNAKKLSTNRSIAREELDARKSEHSVAAAEVNRIAASLRRAALSVEHCKIHAPFAGVIIERIASVGDYAVKGSPIVRLLDSQHLDVAANVQQQDLPSLKAAEKLTFSDWTDVFEVRIRTILPILDTKLRSYEVRLSFIRDSAVPGATGRLFWKRRAPHIPPQYLLRRGTELGVFIVSEGIARFHPLPDALEGKPARFDLPEDAQLILEGRFNIRDGDSVQVIESSGNR